MNATKDGPELLRLKAPSRCAIRGKSQLYIGVNIFKPPPSNNFVGAHHPRGGTPMVEDEVGQSNLVEQERHENSTEMR